MRAATRPGPEQRPAHTPAPEAPPCRRRRAEAPMPRRTWCPVDQSKIRHHANCRGITRICRSLQLGGGRKGGRGDRGWVEGGWARQGRQCAPRGCNYRRLQRGPGSKGRGRLVRCQQYGTACLSGAAANAAALAVLPAPAAADVFDHEPALVAAQQAHPEAVALLLPVTAEGERGGAPGAQGVGGGQVAAGREGAGQRGVGASPPVAAAPVCAQARP
jgi:hypothetical protein